MDFDNIDMHGVIVGFMFGFVGMWMIKEAKSKSNIPLFFISLALMIFPYFITDALYVYLVGGGLCYASYKIW